MPEQLCKTKTNIIDMHLGREGSFQYGKPPVWYSPITSQPQHNLSKK